ncbi:MAG: NAD(P)/FAD-dependent oxidoreductase [Chloroflexi bacterium]|nr:NAD(P)/FAD-dependent oxidoreductase [Chloroflexota bacterium]
MEEVQITVIGAGVVGLAVAAELARDRQDRQVYLLERNTSFGRETSSRNSGVVHAGIYYPTVSLKARLWFEGNTLIHKLCIDHGITHWKIGKLLVASTNEELPELEKLWKNGIRNGAHLRLVSTAGVKRLEPNVKCVGAVLSPSTGIIDSYGLMSHFFGLARGRGAKLAYRAEVTGLERDAGCWRVLVQQDSRGLFEYRSKVVVNCAGLWSSRIAQLAGINTEAAGYTLHYCKGQYFGMRKRLVRRLVYPVPRPHDAGLGIHFTPDLEGRLRLGPDTQYVPDLDYTFDETKRMQFAELARNVVPLVDPEDLEPDIIGIRPKLQGPGEGFRDFVIRHEVDRDMEGLINLIGIESPGLTASPAIARYVKRIVDEVL